MSEVKQLVAEATEALNKAICAIEEEYKKENLLRYGNKMLIHIADRRTLSFCICPKDGGTCTNHKTFDFWGNQTKE